MKLYCERTLIDSKTGFYEVILAFSSDKDMLIFSELFGLNIEDNNGTILLLTEVRFKKYKGFRSGKWYSIPQSFFQGFELINEQDENSRIKAELKYTSSTALDVQYNLVTNDRELNTILSSIDINQFKLSEYFSKHIEEAIKRQDDIKNIKLIVRDVGCGNWNEVRTDDFLLLYDLGGDIKYTNHEMRQIVGRAMLNQEYGVIISHWDLDHYRAILELTDDELKLMKYIIVPTKMPNTKELIKTINRLNAFDIPICVIPPSNRTGRKINLTSLGVMGIFELYRSSDGSKINQSGIVLSVEGNNKVGILTGDHHYNQLHESVFSSQNVKPFIFVVPHHGGNAGVFKSSLWASINFVSGAMSTKKNGYRNMPLPDVHKHFIDDRNFHCTDCSSNDYITNL